MAEKEPDRAFLIKHNGWLFRELRISLELTQLELAEILSFKNDTAIDVKTISKWENGKARLPAWAKTQLEDLIEQYDHKQHARASKGAALEQKKARSNAILDKIKDSFKGNS